MKHWALHSKVYVASVRKKKINPRKNVALIPPKHLEKQNLRGSNHFQVT